MIDRKRSIDKKIKDKEIKGLSKAQKIVHYL